MTHEQRSAFRLDLFGTAVLPHVPCPNPQTWYPWWKSGQALPESKADLCSLGNSEPCPKLSQKFLVMEFWTSWEPRSTMWWALGGKFPVHLPQENRLIICHQNITILFTLKFLPRPCMPPCPQHICSFGNKFTGVGSHEHRARVWWRRGMERRRICPFYLRLRSFYIRFIIFLLTVGDRKQKRSNPISGPGGGES